MTYEDRGFHQKAPGTAIARYCRLPDGRIECALEVFRPNVLGRTVEDSGPVFFGRGHDNTTARAAAELARKVKEAE